LRFSGYFRRLVMSRDANRHMPLRREQKYGGEVDARRHQIWASAAPLRARSFAKSCCCHARKTPLSAMPAPFAFLRE